ncbi:MAG: GGDEF domain-containing protein [Rhizobiaceae bacterium]
MGTASLAVAVVLIVALVNLFGERFETSMWVSAVLGSYGVGSTVSFYLFRQTEQYRAALFDLADTHEQLADAHRLLAERACRDSMTGMYNRAAFMDRLGKQAARKESGALLIVDADHFKAINDTYGHQAGDRALLAIAGAIDTAFGGHGFTGRLGGEEFGVFLIGADLARATAIAERIRRAVENSGFSRDEPEGSALSVSIGVEAVSSAWSVEDAVRVADNRLYAAKLAGRNRVMALAA